MLRREREDQLGEPSRDGDWLSGDESYKDKSKDIHIYKRKKTPIRGSDLTIEFRIMLSARLTGNYHAHHEE